MEIGASFDPLDGAAMAGESGRDWDLGAVDVLAELDAGPEMGAGLDGEALGALTAFGGWLRMDGPAARTVSMAVEMAVCMGMLRMAVTVAAIIEAMYLEYSFV